MTRRKAMLALVVGTAAAFVGQRVYGSEAPDSLYSSSALWKPTLIRWDMDTIEAIELQKGGETITISTAEIFEALKEKR